MNDLLLHIIAYILIIGAAVGAFVYLVRRGNRAVSIGCIFADYRLSTECALCFSAVLIGLFLFQKGINSEDKTYIRALIDGLTAVWLLIIGYIDLKEQIIPNEMIGCGLLVWVQVVVMDVFVAGTSWIAALVYSLSGGFVIGGILFVIAILMKSALGMGDVKMFLVVGLLYGLSDTYMVLLMSLLLMAIVSVTLLALKKVTAKTTVPMAPFVVAGFIISLLAGM